MCQMGDPNEEEQKLEGVTTVNDSDVLCGRGGAALRHAGNQTYRKLVSLNKGLYITCLKTEKLKISRSIVAAIREKKGRFLEKDNKTGTWYDIGDKKAVEKTSQALREGQPKLRQQIVEMGGGAAGAASLIESQFGPQAAAAVAGAGLYPGQGQLQAGGGPRSIMAHGQHPPQMHGGNGVMRQQMMNAQQGYASGMPPPQQQQRQMSGGLPFDDIQNDLMSRLSLHDDSSSGGMHLQQQGNMQMRQMMSNGMGMSGTMPTGMRGGAYGGYGGGGQMNQMGMVNANDMMADSFHAALRGMNSPPASIQNSLHSTQHTLDFSSMHSLDFMSGLSDHSIGGMASNHTMGPPSAHMPTMSSMPRQHQIDERYPQNLGLNPHNMNQQSMNQQSMNQLSMNQQSMNQQNMNQQYQGQVHQGSPQLGQPHYNSFNPQNMTQSFQRQVQNSQAPQPPSQPRQPQQHSGQSPQSVPQKYHPGQEGQMHPGQPGQVHPGQPMRPYRDTTLSQGNNAQLEPLPVYDEESTEALPRQQQQHQRLQSTADGYPPETTRVHSEGRTGQDQQGQGTQGQSRNEDQQQNSETRQALPTDNSKPKDVGSSTTTQNVVAPVATSQPSVLSPEARQKLVDRRSILAKMKYRKPPSVRDNTKMGISAMSTHSSTGDGMPDIYMVESQRSLHSAMSTMTDGVSSKQNTSGTSKDHWVESSRLVDHSSRDYPDVYAAGSKLSIMSGLSKISDHSFNDVSIFSGLSNKIGNVSTRSIAAMSEISVIEVAAENEEEDEAPSTHNDEPAEQKQESSSS